MCPLSFVSNSSSFLFSFLFFFLRALVLLLQTRLDFFSFRIVSSKRLIFSRFISRSLLCLLLDFFGCCGLAGLGCLLFINFHDLRSFSSGCPFTFLALQRSPSASSKLPNLRLGLVLDWLFPKNSKIDKTDNNVNFSMIDGHKFGETGPFLRGNI